MISLSNILPPIADLSQQIKPYTYNYKTVLATLFICDMLLYREADMKTVKIGNLSGVPSVAVGCMRIPSLDEKKATEFVAQAVANGLNFFDHADIYGCGESEKLFAKAVKNAGLKREDLLLQSKCGIVRGKMYDFSKQHILNSVDGILSRLDTDYIEILLLHRPDALMQPEEVGEAFDTLRKQGKVRQFGVSNMRPMQIELLQSGLNCKLAVNQIQFSPAHAGAIRSGFEFNMLTDGASDKDGSVIEYCRLKGITLQAWSPFQHGFFKGTYIDDPDYEKLNAALEETGNHYGISKSAAAVAWICRHPANIQTVTGTTNIARLLEIKKGADVTISREEWYKIYTAAGNRLP